MRRTSGFGPGQVIPESRCRRFLEACGQHIKVYSGCRIINPVKVSIGDYSQIDEGVFINGGTGVTIGAHVHLAFGSSISGGGECFIGDFAGVGAGVKIITGSEMIDGLLTNPTVPPEFRLVQRDRVVICPHAIIFTNALLLPGITIGAGAVVSAGSLVHRDLKPWRIYGGNPLVEIGRRPKEVVLKAGEELTRTGYQFPAGEFPTPVFENSKSEIRKAKRERKPKT